MRFIINCMALLVTIFFVGDGLAARPDECQEIEARMEELNQELEDSPRLNDLARIQNELGALSMKYMERCMGGTGGGGFPSMSGDMELMTSPPASTPEEEIIRQRKIINIQRQQIEQNRASMITEGEEQLVPVPRAVPIRGSVVINGGFKSSPYRGWVWHEITYSVTESFVGNLIIKEYFSTRTGQYTEGKDYSMATLSTGINVTELGGRKCLKASSGLPGYCVDWESFQRHEVAKDEIYPGFYAEALFAETENDQVVVRTKSPTVTFKSFSGRATDGLGCFSAEKAYSRDQFNSLIEQGKIQFTEEVGSDSQATPGCSRGSTISLEMFIDRP